MSEPITAYLVVCASDACEWAPKMTMSTTRSLAETAAKIRNGRPEVCGPHRAVEVMEAEAVRGLVAAIDANVCFCADLAEPHSGCAIADALAALPPALREGA